MALSVTNYFVCLFFNHKFSHCCELQIPIKEDFWNGCHKNWILWRQFQFGLPRKHCFYSKAKGRITEPKHSHAISLVLISNVFVKRQKDVSVFTARLTSRRFWFFASINSQHAHLLNFSLFHVFRQASNFTAEFGTKGHSNGPINVVKNPPANEGAFGSIPGWGRFPEKGNGNPFQYSCLGNPMDRGAWQAIVHGVAKRAGHNLAT